MTTIPAANTNTPASAAATTSATAQTQLNKDTQNFYTLLTTQLKNQDPTAPTDTNQITQEIAQLNTVQQGIDTNNKLATLISLLTSNQVSNAVSYIGKQVDATGNQTELSGSKANMAYTLPSGASSATVTITNSAGATVFSGPGTTIAGRNQVMWNGTNSVTGATMPDGTYNFSVTAKDSSGKAVTATTLTTGIVSAVNTESGTNTLSIGDLSVPLTTIQSVYGTSAATATNTNTTANTHTSS